MGSLKSVAIFALLLSLSLAVFADTSNDATHAKGEVKPSEATEAKDVVVEPQQRWGGGCRYGCCGGWRYGRCNYCCRQPKTVEAEAVEANEVEPQTVETEAVEASDVEPQQRGGRGGGGCRYGCCRWRYGRCNYCCRSQAEAQTEAEAVEAVEPQQGWGGGYCRYGCCGPWRYGRCSYCCRSSQAETEAVKTVEPQQGWGGGYCRYGCCGGWRYGRCNYCCTKKMTTEEEKKNEEAKP